MRAILRASVLLMLLVGATACASIQERVMEPKELINDPILESQEVRPPLNVEIVHQEELKFVFSDPILGFENTTYDYSKAVIPALLDGLSRSYALVPEEDTANHVEIHFTDIEGDLSCRKYTFYQCSQGIEFGALVIVNKGGERVARRKLAKSRRASGSEFFLPVTAFDPLHMKAAPIAFSKLIAEIVVFADEALGLER